MTTKLEQFYTQLDLNGTKLAHWGVKGMKWGIRRSDAELARASNSDATDAIRARTTQKAIQKSGSLSSVSDSDLNQLVNRINLERRYSEANPSTASKGHSQIKTILKAGQTMNDAITFSRSPAGKFIAGVLLKKKIGRYSR